MVYRGMDIGSGKDLAEYSEGGATVAHHLVDLVEPTAVYTLWEFLGDFYEAVRSVRSRNAMPVAVGGTGLYLEAALKHYEIPNVTEDPEFRKAMMQVDRESLAD